MDEQEIKETIGEILGLLILFQRNFIRPVLRVVNEVSPAQIAVLCALAGNGDISMTRLSQEVSVSSQQLTRLVEGLVQRGYVSRSKNPDNRRLVLISLTGDGVSFLQSFQGRAIELLYPYFAAQTNENARALFKAIHTIHHIAVPPSTH
ncbi:MAG: MarR family transcriptional regulator [Oscillospiraceae bacterium]